MDTFALLAHGLAGALQPMNLLYALIGVTLGTAVGVLPGIGPALTVALLLPVTYQLDPTASLIMFAGIYYGGMYGGSTTSILLNTPGESASIVTALEGNKMARKGRGGPALATAAIGSFVAGLIATIGLAFIAPWMVKFALSLGPADYFALMVLAFVTVSAAFGDSALRGLTALALGLTLGLVGIDLQTGQARLAFGVPDLLDGIEVTTLAVALFAIGEALKVAGIAGRTPRSRSSRCAGSVWMTRAGLGAVVEALAARHRDRLPDRRDAGGRRGDRHLPQLLDREGADQAPRGVRPRRDRGRRRAGGREQRLRRGHAGAAPDARACRPPPPRRSCWRASSSSGCSPGRCSSPTTRRWSGA